MITNYEIIGKNIKYFRKLRKLTQEQLAEALDLSVGFISQLERGITKMSLDTLIDLCDILDCSSSDILGLSQYSHNDTISYDFFSLYKKLPVREQHLFYHMLEAYINYM